MKKTYTTAQGKHISMDNVRLSNEDVIAVGNMKVNARGDKLGPGGVPEETRQQSVSQYYNLHTPVVGASKLAPGSGVIEDKPKQVVAAPVPSADPLIDEQDQMPTESETKMRGNLADTIAKQSTSGPSRI
jgi:hypothetical protein